MGETRPTYLPIWEGPASGNRPPIRLGAGTQGTHKKSKEFKQNDSLSQQTGSTQVRTGRASTITGTRKKEKKKVRARGVRRHNAPSLVSLSSSWPPSPPHALRRLPLPHLRLARGRARAWRGVLRRDAARQQLCHARHTATGRLLRAAGRQEGEPDGAQRPSAAGAAVGRADAAMLSDAAHCTGMANRRPDLRRALSPLAPHGAAGRRGARWSE